MQLIYFDFRFYLCIIYMYKRNSLTYRNFQYPQMLPVFLSPSSSVVHTCSSQQSPWGLCNAGLIPEHHSPTFSPPSGFCPIYTQIHLHMYGSTQERKQGCSAGSPLTPRPLCGKGSRSFAVPSACLVKGCLSPICPQAGRERESQKEKGKLCGPFFPQQGKMGFKHVMPDSSHKSRLQIFRNFACC